LDRVEHNSGSNRASNDRFMYSTFELDAEEEPIQVQLSELSNYSGMMSTTVQLQVHDVCNCTITAQIRAAMTNQIQEF